MNQSLTDKMSTMQIQESDLDGHSNNVLSEHIDIYGIDVVGVSKVTLRDQPLIILPRHL